MGKKRIVNDKRSLNQNNRRKNELKDERNTKSSSNNDDDSSNLSNLEGMKKYVKQNNPELDDIFEFQEYIGSGAESYVYKTIIKKNGKIVANKMIVIKEKERERKRIFNEIMISRKLKHQNIIDFYGCYEVKKNEVSCIVMEYSKYGNLRDFRKNVLKGKIYTETFLCFIAHQILTALKYLEMCKVAHLDLKPQNITINEFLTVKLIDFSISVDYSRINSNKIELSSCGTKHYMAPEVISSKTINVKNLNKVDLFSLGVVLYNLAFGAFPFNYECEDFNNKEEIYNKIMNSEIEFDNSLYSSHFIDFLKKLLEKDINKRIDINQALNHYWVRGAKLILEEKENLYNAGKFLAVLITDHIKNFSDYLNKSL
jgi:serine/threonine protein kinase